jgi:hypothetical protein
MSANFYRQVRDLHLYLGLIMSPFVLLFAISVFFLTHRWLPKIGPRTSSERIVSALPLPAELDKLSGRPLVDALRPVLEFAKVPGEVGFVQHLVREQMLIIPVIIPGRETTVTVCMTNREATIITREMGIASALVTLHKSPGGHGPTIRMNWLYMKAWRWLADATVYLILFISLSGVYLWYALRSERKIGYALLAAGAVSFFGMAYALSY